MKKVILSCAALALILSLQSCRETTEEKALESAAQDTKNNIEAAGNAIEDVAEKTGQALEEAGEEIEGAAKDANRELNEEIEGTDDVNGDDDN